MCVTEWDSLYDINYDGSNEVSNYSRNEQRRIFCFIYSRSATRDFLWSTISLLSSRWHYERKKDTWSGRDCWALQLTSWMSMQKRKSWTFLSFSLMYAIITFKAISFVDRNHLRVSGDAWTYFLSPRMHLYCILSRIHYFDCICELSIVLDRFLRRRCYEFYPLWIYHWSFTHDTFTSSINKRNYLDLRWNRSNEVYPMDLNEKTRQY